MVTSDYIANFLKDNEIKIAFGIIGAANSYIFDSIATLGYTEIVSVHHEQAAVMAMGAYYRVSGKLSVCLVTAAAGSSNSVTGILSNWADSIPGIIIAGQESTSWLNKHKDLRMYGTQGFDFAGVCRPITKYSTRLLTEHDIKYELDKCLYVTQEGRPGPVVIEIPFDIQSRTVDTSTLTHFFSDFTPISYSDKDKFGELISMLREAKRPVIVGGYGVILSKANESFSQLVNDNDIPTLLSWSAISLLDHTNKNFYGSFGLHGQRHANFIIQNADLVLVLGSRLALPQVGHDINQFARNAKICLVDIDDTEYKKHENKISLYFKDDCKYFLNDLLMYDLDLHIESWREECRHIKQEYPVIEECHMGSEYVDSSIFIKELSKHLKDNHIVVTDMGTALLSGFQCIELKNEQKMFTSLGLGEMGYGLPGAIGASFVDKSVPVLCLNCDGGIMMNLQELHTIIYHNLNVKIIIFNNDGYLMIKNTQKMLFDDRHVCVDKKSGVSCPDFKKISYGFGYDYFRIDKESNVSDVLEEFLNNDTQSICEVFMNPEQEFLPKVKGYKLNGKIIPSPLEDMSPLLPLSIIEKEMKVEISTNSFKIRGK